MMTLDVLVLASAIVIVEIDSHYLELVVVQDYALKAMLKNFPKMNHQINSCKKQTSFKMKS
jgi:hypothetical protein